MPLTENNLPIGHDLEIADNYNDQADDATVTTPYTHGHNITSYLAMPSGRYPR